MKVRVAKLGTTAGQEVTVEIDDPTTDTLETVKLVVEAELGVPASQQTLWHGVRVLNASFDSRTLASLGIKDNDLLTLLVSSPQPAGSSASPSATSSLLPPSLIVPPAPTQQQAPAPAPAGGMGVSVDLLRGALSQANTRAKAEARDFIAQMRGDPEALDGLLAQNPELAEAVLSDNIDLVQEMLSSLKAAAAAAHAGQEGEEDDTNNAGALQAKIDRLQATLAADPLNATAQQELEGLIQLANVRDNFDYALEHNPEAFAPVTMLYCKVEVNRESVPCLVDSGAQDSVMSVEVAQKCGIYRLVDTRFHGEVAGVGRAKALGRVHSTMIKIGNQFLNCSFTVVDGLKGLGFLLGLDLLKRHRAIIDLDKSCLRINGEAIPFLTEGEIPDEIKHLFDKKSADDSSPSSSSSSAAAPGRSISGPPATSNGSKP